MYVDSQYRNQCVLIQFPVEALPYLCKVWKPFTLNDFEDYQLQTLQPSKFFVDNVYLTEDGQYIDFAFMEYLDGFSDDLDIPYNLHFYYSPEHYSNSYVAAHVECIRHKNGEKHIAQYNPMEYSYISTEWLSKHSHADIDSKVKELLEREDDFMKAYQFNSVDKETYYKISTHLLLAGELPDAV